jgi:hypothetical protein
MRSSRATPPMGRPDAVLPGRECVSELVQHHAAKHRQDEPDPCQHGGCTLPLQPVGQSHLADQQKEGGVNKHTNTRKLSELPRPFHKLNSSGLRLNPGRAFSVKGRPRQGPRPS